MNQRGSSGRGGSARNVEPERCRLDGTVFLGAIVVAVGLKSTEKKNAHQTRARDKGSHKNRWREKNGQPRIFIAVGIRVASPQ